MILGYHLYTLTFGRRGARAGDETGVGQGNSSFSPPSPRSQANGTKVSLYSGFAVSVRNVRSSDNRGRQTISSSRGDRSASVFVNRECIRQIAQSTHAFKQYELATALTCLDLFDCAVPVFCVPLYAILSPGLMRYSKNSTHRSSTPEREGNCFQQQRSRLITFSAVSKH